MKISSHAMKRSTQRGIKQAYIEMILKWGTPKTKPGDAVEYRLRNKEKN